MGNDYFQFKQFAVRNGKCAMRVGTDGTLLGAWARGGEHILDIGTGTGLIALMMAQRFPASHIVAIDIDGDACAQAEENIGASPFASRISVSHTSLQRFAEERVSDGEAHGYDAVVCNPPYFVGSLECPDDRRTLARHASSLSFSELFSGVKTLLSQNGTFSAIVPTESFTDFDAEARLAGLFLVSRCQVRTVPRKQPRRCLLTYSRQPAQSILTSEQCLCDAAGNRSPWYQELTQEFYIR